ncbi:MAG: hypothetical protein R2834_01260 [Rhodothermales bacterium]
MRFFLRIMPVAALGALFMMQGCANLNAPNNNSQSQLYLSEFMQRLSEKGITAREKGPISEATITSTFGERLLLNERDIVDVYFFRDDAQAKKESNVAETLALYDVYLEGNIVLFHRVGFDPMVRNALEDMFGLPK